MTDRTKDRIKNDETTPTTPTTSTVGAAAPATAFLEAHLTRARGRIEVTAEELAEARTRRSAIGAALREEFTHSRVYSNGSVAHRDALTPLTDIDLGVVVAEAQDTHGPGQKGPSDLQERAAEAIRRELKPTYGELRVEVKGRKRSILVRFNDPVSDRVSDFTADVIIAIEHPSGIGLYIPRYQGWDRSHPEGHTELIATAIRATGGAYAHIVRLLKHWNRRHGKPLCSWNIKALALGCLSTPMTQLDGLLTWFEHAAKELTREETPDPAGVADKPIKLNAPQRQVLDKLTDAAQHMSEAIHLAKSGYPALAQQQLARLFNDDDMMPHPDTGTVLDEEAHRRRAQLAAGTVSSTAAHPRPQVPVKSWAP